MPGGGGGSGSLGAPSRSVANRRSELAVPPVTHTDRVNEVIEVFRASEHFDLFLRGAAMGAEGVDYADTHNDGNRRVVAPLTAVVEQPAWEGSHSTRMLEHDFVYSMGVVIGAFIARSPGMGLDTALEPDTLS